MLRTSPHDKRRMSAFKPGGNSLVNDTAGTFPKGEYFLKGATFT